MEEYKIISGTTTDCQKLLNQWKHQYFLNIVNMCADKDLTVILLTRTEKVEG